MLFPGSRNRRAPWLGHTGTTTPDRGEASNYEQVCSFAWYTARAASGAPVSTGIAGTTAETPAVSTATRKPRYRGKPVVMKSLRR